MAGSALKRLMAEYRQLCKNPSEGIVAGPKVEENFFEWECLIMGPSDTPFEYGVFPASLSFPKDYPIGNLKKSFSQVDIILFVIYLNVWYESPKNEVSHDTPDASEYLRRWTCMYQYSSPAWCRPAWLRERRRTLVACPERRENFNFCR